MDANMERFAANIEALNAIIENLRTENRSLRESLAFCRIDRDEYKAELARLSERGWK